MSETPYDRDVLTTVLIYHQRKSAQFCGCGWGELGKSHADHVVDVYEQSVAASNRHSEPRSNDAPPPGVSTPSEQKPVRITGEQET